MYKRVLPVLSGVLWVILSVAVVVSQSNCAGLLADALLAVDENCSTTGRNEACYGYDQVEASFLDEIDDLTFSQPRDIAPVAEINTIRTAPLSVANGTWGVALMNIQANLPNTLPGQNVTFILMGDVEVDNAVDAETAFNPSDGIEVVVATVAGANIRSGPGLNFNVIGGTGAEGTLLADGVSEDGEWLRIIYRNRPAWVNRVTLLENEEIDTLPVLSSGLQTPMQAFYLRTGTGQPECEEAPGDLLLVQGPENIEIELNVNGANISLGSSGIFRTVEIDGQLFLEIIVFDGTFHVDGQVIQRGQRSFLCVDPNSDGRLVVSCEASPPEPVPLDEFDDSWCYMENVSSNILNYGLDVPCSDDPPPAPPATNGGGNTNTSESEVEGVDCSSFRITTPNIVATDFILTWTPATGATEYHVVVFDNTGSQLSIEDGITETSLDMNGGVGFASSGSVHVRAFANGAYACVATLGFSSREPDPNEPPGGYTQPGAPPVYNSQLVACYDYSDFHSAVVSWSNATGSITITLDDGTTATQGGANGSYELFTSPGAFSGVAVTHEGLVRNFTCTNFIIAF